MELMAERLESVKAGIMGSISLGSAFLITSLFNGFVLTEYLPILVTKEFNLEVLASGAIAGFSGFLFGVTYRYIIRTDTNPHLKTGGIWAFGLVRGLTQIEVGWNYTDTILPFLIFAGESILWFTFAAIILDTAILLGWLKPFS
ncbi:hypothetical protein H6G54_19525 [Anabaena cylindrica FACHB-243]|uniref:Uncharacterized protein n=1 Tax=Anabaena cylindrica (strain ATCC 27899 / PCC 7122) TaxID=272123 RepID=K9ZHJ2_ANACC|nr:MULTISPECIES: hypothetical protein [Anabaena]AFZ58209.1 hypothetical protein Anacy_2774 [Anabaena cylindrica PCC 7122]MBD2419857.1 hypothetical protein [Anabaena cylindrica FACHB-243]MBY5280983.1 hypothetical protein [Anabaena sp. CCAP 1446/1C]MBY5307366.1 hypothetical protein [Anabaena sp. CCAP 1446/1C]MCM2407944.1 hypothetical protein [Anabaena sp. CCAP 1446/1C]